MLFSERLKELRKEKKLKQEDIANFLNVSRASYGHYETGHSDPPKEVIEKLADFFNVSTDYLLGRTDIREPITDPATPDEINEILENLHKRPEMKMLFSLSKKATKEDIEKAVKIIEALKGE